MNIKVDFDNIVVKEDKNDFNVKVLMLKGEKGDQGDGENNVIEKVQVNGTDLPVTNKTVNVPVPTVDSTLNSSSINPVQNSAIYNALNNKVNNSELNNYYETSEIDNLLNNKVNNSTLGDYYTKQQINNQFETITSHNADISTLSSQISSLASGSPLIASSMVDMTDTSRIYVLTTDGHWYWYNGTTWIDGGVYQSTSLDLDKTLTIEGKAPDSKVVGQRISERRLDLAYFTGYETVDNPLTYVGNSQVYVSGVTPTENSVTFTVASGQTVKGVNSTPFNPFKANTQYTLKFHISLSDNTNPIAIYYNGGSGTISKTITGEADITSTFTRGASDGPLVFFIDNDTENSITASVTKIMIFKGNVGDIETLKDIKEDIDEKEIIKGIDLSTTSSGTYTSNVYIEAGKTYKIDVKSLSYYCNMFSSTDISVARVSINAKGIYYFTPISSGYLSTYAFNNQGFSIDFTVTLLTDKNTLYVSTSGNDINNGQSMDTALATIQKAIDLGARNIIVARGKYYNQSINLTGIGEELSIKAYGGNTFSDTIPDRPLVEIINGTSLNNLTTDETYTTLLSQNFEGNSDWNKVFITHELTPIGNPGYRSYHNAGLWQISGTDTYSNDKRVVPVLTIDECVNTAGTFFWNGTKVYVHPFNTTYTSFIAQNPINYGVRLENLNKVTLQDISIKFNKQCNFYMKNCMDIKIQNCISQYTEVENGFQLRNSNGIVDNCQAYNSRDDGFGSQDYGVISYLNCIGNYNDDDGISQHFGERAYITGGEYAYNGKGGVASPTYGAYVNVYNVYTHHNDCGIYATNESETSDYATRTCFVNNCLITNNRIGIRITGTTHLIGWNNIVKDNTTNIYGSGYIDNDIN